MGDVHRIIATGLLLTALAACAPGGGGSPSPYGGGNAPAATAAPTTAPKAAPVSSPLPSGSAMNDPYGYGY
jgi:hypothetical protein